MNTRELDEKLHAFIHHRRRVMRRFFSECGMFNGHPFMLFLLRESPGITPAELARQMEITPASATVSIKRMESAGLLTRQSDENDRRTVHLFLTARGEEMDDLCRTGKEFAADTQFLGFSARERRMLSDMLERMQHNLEQADTAAWMPAHEKEDQR